MKGCGFWIRLESGVAVDRCGNVRKGKIILCEDCKKEESKKEMLK